MCRVWPGVGFDWVKEDNRSRRQVINGIRVGTKGIQYARWGFWLCGRVMESYHWELARMWKLKLVGGGFPSALHFRVTLAPSIRGPFEMTCRLILSVGSVGRGQIDRTRERKQEQENSREWTAESARARERERERERKGVREEEDTVRLRPGTQFYFFISPLFNQVG